MNWTIKGWSLPTPLKIRKIADSMLAACGFITASSLLADLKIVAIATLVTGFIAKFLSDFYHEDNNNNGPTT